MNGKKISLSTERVLEKMGLRIKKARLRRNINAEALAEESGISRGTLAAIEKGSKSVSIGAYATVLQVLEMETDLELIAVDEDGKKKYANEFLISRKRARGQKGSWEV